MTPDPPVAAWCPDCDGPPTADLYDLVYCWRHVPVRTGADDDRVPGDTTGGYTEAGGESNRAACAWIHREARGQ